jgi:bidirectional [NiFe] hydrogenase diaphorase subunit
MSTGNRRQNSVIDGQEVSARAGQTILEVARENDINIPTLCHLEGLSDVGACRLCLVESRAEQAACPPAWPPSGRHGSQHQHRAPAKAPQDDPRAALRRAQSHLLGLRLQRPLRTADAGQEQGLTHVRLPYRNPELEVDASHERFTLDHNRCILCTRCVRVCAEIEGAHIWDVMGRGIDSIVITDLQQPWGSRPAPLRQVRAGLPHRSPLRQSKIGSDHPKYPDFLPYLNLMREAQ